MKKLLLALALCLCASPVWAQCTGVFPPNTVCGNFSASPAPPAATTLTTSLTGPTSSTSGFIPNWLGTAGVQLGSQNTITTSQVFNFTNTISGSGANNLAGTTSLFVANITSNFYYKGILVNLLSGGGGCTISASSSGYVYNAGSLGCLTSNTLVTSGGLDTETGQFNFLNSTIGWTHTASANGQVVDRIANNSVQAAATAALSILNSSGNGLLLEAEGINATPPNQSFIFGIGGPLILEGQNGAEIGFAPTNTISIYTAQILSPYVIATLPTCNATLAGGLAYVSNGGVGATYYSTVLATGTSPNIVMCNGTGWTYH